MPAPASIPRIASVAYAFDERASDENIGRARNFGSLSCDILDVGRGLPNKNCRTTPTALAYFGGGGSSSSMDNGEFGSGGGTGVDIGSHHSTHVKILSQPGDRSTG